MTLVDGLSWRTLSCLRFHASLSRRSRFLVSLPCRSQACQLRRPSNRKPKQASPNHPIPKARRPIRGSLLLKPAGLRRLPKSRNQNHPARVLLRQPVIVRRRSAVGSRQRRKSTSADGNCRPTAGKLLRLPSLGKQMRKRLPVKRLKRRNSVLRQVGRGTRT